jgi:hypothetical protein
MHKLSSGLNPNKSLMDFQICVLTNLPICHQRKAELDTVETARNKHASLAGKGSWLATMGHLFAEDV